MTYEVEPVLGHNRYKPVAPPPLERWAESTTMYPAHFGAMILGAVIVAGLVLAVAVAAGARRDCADAGGVYVERANVCVKRDVIIPPRKQ